MKKLLIFFLFLTYSPFAFSTKQKSLLQNMWCKKAQNAAAASKDPHTYLVENNLDCKKWRGERDASPKSSKLRELRVLYEKK